MCLPQHFSKLDEPLRRLHTHLQISYGYLVVDLLLVPPLVLRHCDVSQRRLKVQNLLHLNSGGILVSSQQQSQLDHVIQVSLQHLNTHKPAQTALDMDWKLQKTQSSWHSSVNWDVKFCFIPSHWSYWGNNLGMGGRVLIGQPEETGSLHRWANTRGVINMTSTIKQTLSAEFIKLNTVSKCTWMILLFEFLGSTLTPTV